MAELEKGIKDMSLALPSSAEDIAAVAESAGQLGIQTENILGFTKTIIDLSNATNLVGEEAQANLLSLLILLKCHKRTLIDLVQL